MTHSDTGTRETVPQRESWEPNTKLRSGVQEGYYNEFFDQRREDDTCCILRIQNQNVLASPLRTGLAQ